MMARVLRRTSRALAVDETVFATTTDPPDDAVAAYCESANLPYFRGSLYDVLERLYQAARRTEADVVVRVTADCPLIDPGLIDNVVAAVLQAQGRDPAGVALAVADLEPAVADPTWPPVLQAFARCARIVRGQKVGGAVDSGLFDTDAERGLLLGLDKVRHPVESVDELVRSLRALVPPITDFFDKVLVMDEDKAKRANRLALVRRVVELADGIADLSKLEGF